MNANELRLNNLFRQNGSNFVETATFETFELLSSGAIVIDGVPINEKWLLEFGFKLNMDNFNWNAAIGVNEIGDFELALRYSERIGWFFQSKCTIIKYLHQLQNLYFDLTGNELLKCNT